MKATVPCGECGYQSLTINQKHCNIDTLTRAIHGQVHNINCNEKYEQHTY